MLLFYFQYDAILVENFPYWTIHSIGFYRFCILNLQSSNTSAAESYPTEHFQWQKEYDESEVADELADVLIYCLYMADAMDFDVKEIILNKMKKNALKYPVDKSKGNAKKYMEL